MVPSPAERPYHHGDLRRVLLAAAVAEVEAVGASQLSLREIARRAGVSHAAPAHHFGDKAGIFTAIAVEGFRRAVETIQPAARGEHGFIDGGRAYVAFALANPGYFEVMFRPDLHRSDDPDLVAARTAAFDLLYGRAQESVGSQDVTGLVIAGWAMAHGFATLAQTANLRDRLGDDDPAAVAELITRGAVMLGELSRQRLGADRDVTDTA